MAPRHLPHTSPQVRPRSTSLLRKDTTPTPTITTNPRAHPPTTRPNTPRASLLRRASTRASMATRASPNNTRSMASTGKYQARPPTHLLRNTVNPSTRKATVTRKRLRHMGATSRAHTMGRRHLTLRPRANTRARQGMVPTTVACHITTAAILLTRCSRAFCYQERSNPVAG
jgi:hypothetical protein